MPENVGTRYRAAADRERIPGLNLYAWQGRLAAARPARAAWHALPTGLRHRIDRAFTVMSYRTQMWNARRGTRGEEISPAVVASLRAHFLPDGARLAELVGRDVPWLAGWGAS